MKQHTIFEQLTVNDSVLLMSIIVGALILVIILVQTAPVIKYVEEAADEIESDVEKII
jgi:hypothetical protein